MRFRKRSGSARPAGLSIYCSEVFKPVYPDSGCSDPCQMGSGLSYEWGRLGYWGAA